ncbi:hypothetical protein Ahy_B07g086954 isoform A [Arachis hypogaea]|uniref:Uncharacterized protein n=1 Tax=Arachis hypogaea TaxID=3818 RepID=A0A444YB07_ARAHY|nr:hypothetical protein Ahy_B07g086954 isoform A [Arachis hypogaea]
MIRNRPLEIPEVQFRKLIRYWSLPAIKAMSAKNTENKSKQTCPHQMGTTKFGIGAQTRDSKENNEELSRAEAELQTCIEARKNDEDAFVGVLENDQVEFIVMGLQFEEAHLKKMRRFDKSKLNTTRRSHH